MFLFKGYIQTYSKSFLNSHEIKNAMDELDEKDESAPIVTTTRVPPENFESDDASDDEYPPTLTATRVS